MEQYHILERIGEGAHGVVLKAKHLKVCRIQEIDQTPHKLFVTDRGTGGTEENPTEKARRWDSKFSFEVL